jgi:two-component system, OmpR family, sensor kinase ParS
MIRLFAKMYGLLIATLIFSFIIQIEVIDYYRTLSGAVSVRDRFKGTFHLIEDALKNTPPAAWNTRFDELKQGFGNPAWLEPMNDVRKRLAANDEAFDALKSESLQAFDRPAGGFYLAKRVPGTEMGVVLEFPGPKDLRNQINIINWSIEMLMMALLLWFWVRPFWRDLLALRGAAEKAGGGNLDVKVEVRKGSPLAEFARVFNEMTVQISALMKSQKNLTNSVSHELRTPLARLRFSQHLACEESTTEGKDRYLTLMERDIDELDELSSELLTYAKLESGMPDFVLVKVPAQPWMDDLVDGAQRLAEAKEKNISIDAGVDSDELLCEPRYMGRAVSNLLSNAVRFAESRILVTVTRQGPLNVIHVDDDGPGIVPAERERLFRPFTRLDKSRDRSTGGFGMGLAIVSQIALWHGGRASVSDAPLGGARLTITWPTRRPAATNPADSHVPSQSATNEVISTV